MSVLPADAASARRLERNKLDRLRYATDAEYAEKKRRRSREYCRRNAERNRARAAAWASANPDKVRERSVKHYNANKDAHRRYQLKKQYGITIEQYNAMRVAQRDRCAICETKVDGNLHIDHCHKTGRVRGLLCNRCNRAIGMMQDSELILQAAAGYIHYHNMVIANASD